MKILITFLQTAKCPFLKLLWFISIVLHLCAWFIVINNGQYLLNDSVIYLTMAENFKNYGVISQSFYEPIVPDFQRSPLYPIFLAFLPISLALFIQHILILLSGYLIQKLVIFLQPKTQFFYYLGVLFTFMPYSINLSSLILTESLFIFFLTISGVCLIMFLHNKKWHYLVFLSLALIICSYTRASIVPFLFWIIIIVYFFSRSIRYTLILIILIITGLFPWIYRNHSYTGWWFFTTASQITTLYGRIGGTILAFDKNMNQDAYLKVHAEQLVSHQYEIHIMKKYPHNIINEENEMIQLPLLWIYIKQHVEMPLNALFFHLRCIFQQMSGLSYGMSKYLYSNEWLAKMIALIQALFIGGIYTLFIRLGMKSKEKKLWISWFLGIIFWLLIHNAAWADGRYRYITDLWCILGIVVIGREQRE